MSEASSAASAPAIQRQFVNFAFYKLDPAFRRLNESEKQQARAEFCSLMDMRVPGFMCLTSIDPSGGKYTIPGPDPHDQQDARRWIPVDAAFAGLDDQAQHVHRQGRPLPHR